MQCIVQGLLSISCFVNFFYIYTIQEIITILMYILVVHLYMAEKVIRKILINFSIKHAFYSPVIGRVISYLIMGVVDVINE